jgi:hypothetical protein
MPQFSDYQDVEVDVVMNIDVDEYYKEMDEEERREMFNLLIKGGFGIGGSIPSGRSSWEFDEAMGKLKQNYHALANEETDLIIKLSKRF